MSVDQSEDADLVRRVTAVTREADEVFQRVGGSSRHWASECFLPLLNKAGLAIIDAGDTSPLTPTQIHARLAIMTRARNHWKARAIAAEVARTQPTASVDYEARWRRLVVAVDSARSELGRTSVLEHYMSECAKDIKGDCWCGRHGKHPPQARTQPKEEL